MPTKGRILIKLRVPEEIVTLIRGCHPKLKRKIRAGLRHILDEPESGKWLKDAVEGMQSYRISRFRIIYRRSSPRIIDIVAIGPRKTIYEETYRMIKKESHPPLWWSVSKLCPSRSNICTCFQTKPNIVLKKPVESIGWIVTIFTNRVLRPSNPHAAGSNPSGRTNK